jgi:DNA-directed RNA polymerase specialized sigma24 family protein
MSRPPTKKLRVLALHEAGLSHEQIARHLNCCRAYIRATLQRAKHGGSRPIDLIHGRRKKPAKHRFPAEMETA